MGHLVLQLIQVVVVVVVIMVVLEVVQLMNIGCHNLVVVVVHPILVE
jgi:hypothetical protein